MCRQGISRQIEELPNHPSLLNKPRWNISSDIKAPIHHERFLKSERARHNNSQKWKNKVPSYQSPIEAYKKRRDNERAEKMAAYKKKHASYSDALPSAGLYDRLEAEAKLRAEEAKLAETETFITS